MAITNPEAIRFSNENVRPIADRLAQLYYAAKLTANRWAANNMGTLIPVDGGVLRDSASPSDDNGTGGDGRHVVTGNDITNLINRCNEIVADFEANGNAKLNTILAVAVNPER